MPDDEFAALLNPFASVISDFGFEVVEAVKSPYFDNRLLTLRNAEMNLQVVRDRGGINAEVSPITEPDRWLPLGHLRQIVLERDPTEEPSISEEAAFLCGNYATVVQLLLPNRIEDTYERVLQLGRDRLNKLFPGSVVDDRPA